MAARQKPKPTETIALMASSCTAAASALTARVCTGLRFLWTAFILAHGVLTALSATAAETATPLKVKVSTDIVYASVDGVQLKCDVYTPADGETAGARPAVLLIHGGAWSAGSRRTMGGYGMRLARAGMVAVAIDYRLAPTWKFPTQVDDVRLAMLWAAEQADQLGINPQRIGLFGYSAGGHLACMIGTLVDEPLETRLATTSWASDDPRLQQLPQPLAICAGGPPCDLTVLSPKNGGLAFFLGGSPAEVPKAYVAASPISHASAGDVPTLYVHGERDAIVPHDSSRSLYEAQRKAGVQSEFLTIPKQGHLYTFICSETAEATVEFFQKWLQPQPPQSIPKSSL